MQNGVNKVLLVGNLTADPQIIPTKPRHKHVNLFGCDKPRLEKQRRWQKVSETDFHKGGRFRKTREITRHIFKKRAGKCSFRDVLKTVRM